MGLGWGRTPGRPIRGGTGVGVETTQKTESKRTKEDDGPEKHNCEGKTRSYTTSALINQTVNAQNSGSGSYSFHSNENLPAGREAGGGGMGRVRGGGGEGASGKGGEGRGRWGGGGEGWTKLSD